MAVRALTVIDNNLRAIAFQWAGLLQSSLDTGAPFEGGDYADRSVQLTGTLGAGGALVLEGSNDGATYTTLTDPQGTPITLDVVGELEQIEEITRFVRPRVTAGDGTTNLIVWFYGRRL